MSHTEDTIDDSSITDINNEQQDDVQTKPPSLAKTRPTDSDIRDVLESKPYPMKNELPGEPPKYLREQESEDNVHLVAFLVATLGPKIGLLIHRIQKQIAQLSNVGEGSSQPFMTIVTNVQEIIDKLLQGCRLDDIVFQIKDPVFLRQLLEDILRSQTSSSLDDSSITGINNELQDDVQPTSEPLARDPTASSADIGEVLASAPGQNQNVQPTTLRDNARPIEQEPEAEVYGVLNLVAILLSIVGREYLTDSIIRRLAFLLNVGGCFHHRYRTSEYVRKVEEIIEKLFRGYGLDEIIFGEKDPVFLRQFLEHILDSEIISPSLDAVLEALLEPAPCHTRANANLPAPFTEEDP